MKTKFETITSQVNELKESSKYDRGAMFARARYIYKNSICSWSEAVTQSWDDIKKVVSKKRTELKAAIVRLSTCYNVIPSQAYFQAEMERQMMIGYELGSIMN
jgi:hypothetical protein